MWYHKTMKQYLDYMASFHNLPITKSNRIKEPKIERADSSEPRDNLWCLQKHIDKLEIMARNRHCDKNVVLGRLLKASEFKLGETFYDEDNKWYSTQILNIETLELEALVFGSDEFKSREKATNLIEKVTQ